MSQRTLLRPPKRASRRRVAETAPNAATAADRSPASVEDERTRIAGARVAGDVVEVAWADGHVSRFHHVWLRDNCPMPHSRHPKSGHRLFETAAVPPDIAPELLDLTDGRSLRVVWTKPVPGSDGRESVFPATWLRGHCYSPAERERRRPRPLLWDRAIALRRPVQDFAEIAAGDHALYRMLAEVGAYGFVRVARVPALPGAIQSFVDRFGYIRHTNYGLVFDVVSVPDADHLAYTAVALAMHTDNPYREPVPDYQVVHCVEATTDGGDSLLVDGYLAALRLRALDPAAFDLLTRTPVAFEHTGAGVLLQAEAPLIAIDEWGAVTRIRFSNRAAAPLQTDPGLVPAFYAAYRTFARILEQDELKLRFLMGAGDLYMVDNQRVLHGRAAFKDGAGGRRFLQGCYVDRDVVASKLRVLARQLENPDALRVGTEEGSPTGGGVGHGGDEI